MSIKLFNENYSNKPHKTTRSQNEYEYGRVCRYQRLKKD